MTEQIQNEAVEPVQDAPVEDDAAELEGQDIEPVETSPADDQPAADEPQDDDVQDDEPAVARARREAQKYRTRLRAAEATATTLRNQLIEQHLGDGGVTIKALEAAGVDLSTLIGQDGRIDPEAVNTAADTARTELGIPANRFHGTADQGRASRTPAKPAASWGNLLDPSKK